MKQHLHYSFLAAVLCCLTLGSIPQAMADSTVPKLKDIMILENCPGKVALKGILTDGDITGNISPSHITPNQDYTIEKRGDTLYLTLYNGTHTLRCNTEYTGKIPLTSNDYAQFNVTTTAGAKPVSSYFAGLPTPDTETINANTLAGSMNTMPDVLAYVKSKFEYPTAMAGCLGEFTAAYTDATGVPNVGDRIAADITLPPITVTDYCGNTSDQQIMITVQQVPNDTVTLHYGACDTLLHITPPAYIPPVAAWQNSLVFTNNVNPDSNEGALLGRVAPDTYTITWTVTDPCGGTVSFDKKYVVQYPPCGEGHTVTDADGNAYETVRIGCECWTKSNLKTTKYSDGTAVPFANGYASLDCPDTDANIAAFGRLYTWHSAVRVPEGDNSAVPATTTDPVSGRVYVQGVCPEGWALPSAANLQDVTDRSADAKGLKSADQSKWLPGSAGTDALGFGAVGGGYHDPVAARCMNLLGEAFFWSHDTHTATEASCLAVAYYCEQALYQDKAKGTGYSVRCVKRANAAVQSNGDVAATGLPTVTTGAVSAVFATAATCAGTVTAEGSSAVTERGVCYGVCGSPAVDNSVKVAATGTAGTYSCKLTGLSPATTYYVCAYATNGQGTAYGAVKTFTTKDFPKVTTGAATSVTASTATCGGNVTSDGGAAVTERGVCYGTEANPTVAGSKATAGSGTGVFTCSLTGLADGTAYYVRAYATNGVDTAYGDAVTFTTLSLACTGTPTVTDVDGNVYNTVQIGDQCWMRENLRTTKYSDGTAIALGSSTSTSTSTAYRSNPNDNAAHVPTYGCLYNWKAVMRNSSSSSANPSGVQGVCPAGWHVPSDAEWTQLTDYVSSQSQYQCGGSSTSIAKALASTTGWRSSSETCAVGNNPSGNNATGFSALPAGFYDGSQHYDFGYSAYFWSSTEYYDHAYFHDLGRSGAYVSISNFSKYYGLSVRCLKD